MLKTLLGPKFAAALFLLVTLLSWSAALLAQQQVNVDSKVSVSFIRPIYNPFSRTYDTVGLIRNNSKDTLLTPMSLLVTSTTPSDVKLANADGQTAGGIPFVDVRLLRGEMGPGGFTLVLLKFNNPRRVSFTFRQSVLAVLSGPANNPPVADAGPNQNAAANRPVTLDGSQSFDPDGQLITFAWTQTAGPVVTLDDATLPNPEFTPAVAGDYVFRLVTNDGQANSLASSTTVTVFSGNVPPNADAGTDEGGKVGVPVTLDGTGSFDPDGGPAALSYQWTFSSVPVGSTRTNGDIAFTTSAQPQFTPDVAGTYVLNLNVSDSAASDDDTVQIVATAGNVAPVADAGTDLNINLGDTAALTGSGSFDPDSGPNPLTYSWRLISRPAGSALTNGSIGGAATVNATITPDAAGGYVLGLTVSDGDKSATDNVAVNAIQNNPQPDLTITKTHTGNFAQGSTGNNYTVTVTNSGTGDKTAGQSVSVTDAPPSGLTVTAMSGTGWTCTTLPTCTRSDLLAAGASYPALTVTVSVAAAATSPQVNSITVTTAQAESNSANNTATDSTVITTGVQPDLTITKTHSGSFAQGSTGNNYTVTVTNSGAGDKNAGQSVSVTDAPPSGLTVTAMSGTGWTCTTLPTCTRSDLLAAGASYPALTVTVSVAGNATSPQVNSITVTTAQAESNSANNTATDSTIITVANQAPALANIEGAALSYAENAAATVITAAVTVSDIDSANLASATVQITGNCNNPQDVLGFTNQNGITGVYTAANCLMTLSGSSSVANYQTALRNVTYRNSSESPSTLARTVTFQVNDGAALNNLSNTQTRNITVTASNDAPVAVNKNYNAQANMKIAIAAGGGLLVGATDPDAGSVLSVGTVSATTPAGGTITLGSGGAFDFDPPPGVTGNVTFTYTVCDNGTPQLCSVAATATVNVAGPVIWFVNTAAGAGNGTMLTPFNTLAGATAAMGGNTDQRIFVYSGIQALGTGVTLPASGWLVGQGVTGASFDAVMGISPPAGTLARPSIGGSAPTIRGTVNMNGNNVNVRGLSIQPGSGVAALAATLAGPFTGLVVSDIANVTGSSARAINLNNVSGTFSFATVNASATDIGINLSNVNPSAGSFTVAGTGGACDSTTPTCSGGTISNVTDSGIKLNNTRNVSLTRMRLSGSGNFGLNGTSVTGMSIDTSLFDGTHGNAVNEGALFVTNWLGTGTISNSLIRGGFNDNIRVNNTTGSLNRLTISNSTVRNSGNNHGLAFYTCLAGAATDCSGVVMNLTVSNSIFADNIANHIDTGSKALAQMDLIVNNNTFSNSNPVVFGGAVNITNDHSAHLTFDVFSNTSNNSKLTAFNFFVSNLTTSNASMIGKFRLNNVGTAGVANTASAQGSGLAVTATGAGTVMMNITGNNIRNWATNNGINISAGDGGATGPVVNLNIQNNTVNLNSPSVSQLHGMSVVMGTTSTGGAVNACVDIGGTGAANNMVGSAGIDGFEIRARQRFSSNVRFPGYAGNDAVAAATYLGGRNTVTLPATTNVSVTTELPGTLTGGAACAVAP